MKLEQLIEVVGHTCGGRVLQPLVVEDEAFGQKLVQAGGGPLAELCAARRAHAVTDRENSLEVVMLEDAANLPRPFLANL